MFAGTDVKTYACAYAVCSAVEYAEVFDVVLFYICHLF